MNYFYKYLQDSNAEDLSDYQSVSAFLDTIPDRIYARRAMLILENTNLIELIGQNKTRHLSSVELNALLNDCIAKTGLTMETVKLMLEDICEAFGINCYFVKYFFPEKDEITGKIITALDKGDVSLDTYNGYFIPKDEIDRMLQKADSHLLFFRYDKAVEIYRELSKVGSAIAQYKLGLCYEYGIVTEPDKDLALSFYAASAKNGYSKAAQKVGDYFFYSGSPFENCYDIAYRYYMLPGAEASFNDKGDDYLMTGAQTASVFQNAKANEPNHTYSKDSSSSVKENVTRIINQRKMNLILLVIGGIAAVMLIVFLLMNQVSVHHGYNLLGLGIPVTVIACLIYLCEIVYYSVTKYNSLKYLTVVMMAIWLVFPIFLVVL